MYSLLNLESKLDYKLITNRPTLHLRIFFLKGNTIFNDIDDILKSNHCEIYFYQFLNLLLMYNTIALHAVYVQGLIYHPIQTSHKLLADLPMRGVETKAGIWKITNDFVGLKNQLIIYGKYSFIFKGQVISVNTN